MASKYVMEGDTIVREGVVVADVKNGELIMREGKGNYRMQCAKFLKTVVHNEKKPAPSEETLEDVVNETAKSSGIPKDAKSELDIKNETIEETPIPPMLKAKMSKHNPFGLEPRKNVPECPKGDERGTKSPEVIEWVQKYYPEFEEAIYGDFYRKLEFRKEKEARKQRLLEQSRAGR